MRTHVGLMEDRDIITTVVEQKGSDSFGDVTRGSAWSSPVDYGGIPGLSHCQNKRVKLVYYASLGQRNRQKFIFTAAKTNQVSVNKIENLIL
jgi:hypothetical protein